MKLLESKLDESQITARALTAHALDYFDETEKNLASGRPKGLEKRQKNATKRKEDIEQAVKGLFAPRNDGSAPPGFIKTNAEITRIVEESVNSRLKPPYKPSSLERLVKSFAAKERAKAKR